MNGLSFNFFDESDVVRHHLVQRIIQAYDQHGKRVSEQMALSLDPHSAEPQMPGDTPTAATPSVREQ